MHKFKAVALGLVLAACGSNGSTGSGAGGSAGGSACASDTDCKGTRVCDNGQCVEPGSGGSSGSAGTSGSSGTGGVGGTGGTGNVSGTGGVAGTGGSSPSCDPSSCSGCCQGTSCMPGSSTTACGTLGLQCGACGPAFLCDAGACTVDPASRWDLVVVSGTVPQNDSTGALWDPAGLPDPVVVVQVGSASGATTQSSTQNDTLAPAWNEIVVSDTRADALGAYVVLALWDEDLTFNDLIGSVPFTVGDEFSHESQQYTLNVPIDQGTDYATVVYYVRRH